jgi:hypothetical protein
VKPTNLTKVRFRPARETERGFFAPPIFFGMPVPLAYVAVGVVMLSWRYVMKKVSLLYNRSRQTRMDARLLYVMLFSQNV